MRAQTTKKVAGLQEPRCNKPAVNKDCKKTGNPKTRKSANNDLRQQKNSEKKSEIIQKEIVALEPDWKKRYFELLRKIVDADSLIAKQSVMIANFTLENAKRLSETIAFRRKQASTPLRKIESKISDEEIAEEGVCRMVHPQFKKRRKPIKLICINAGTIEKTFPDGSLNDCNGTDLVLYETYTSLGKYVDENGCESYWINEINGGEGKLVERFRVYK